MAAWLGAGQLNHVQVAKAMPPWSACGPILVVGIPALRNAMHHQFSCRVRSHKNRKAAKRGKAPPPYCSDHSHKRFRAAHWPHRLPQQSSQRQLLQEWPGSACWLCLTWMAHSQCPARCVCRRLGRPGAAGQLTVRLIEMSLLLRAADRQQGDAGLPAGAAQGVLNVLNCMMHVLELLAGRAGEPDLTAVPVVLPTPRSSSVPRSSPKLPCCCLCESAACQGWDCGWLRPGQDPGAAG